MVTREHFEMLGDVGVEAGREVCFCFSLSSSSFDINKGNTKLNDMIQYSSVNGYQSSPAL